MPEERLEHHDHVLEAVIVVVEQDHVVRWQLLRFLLLFLSRSRDSAGHRLSLCSESYQPNAIQPRYPVPLRSVVLAGAQFLDALRAAWATGRPSQADISISCSS